MKYILLLLCTATIYVVGTLAVRPTIAMTADAPTTHRYLINFYDVETDENAPFRWSGEQAALVLDGFKPGTVLLALRLSSPRPPTAPPATASLQSTTWQSGPFVVDGTWRTYHILASLAGDPSVELKADLFTPKINTRRSIGVALSHVKATQLTRGPWYEQMQAFGIWHTLLLLLMPLGVYGTTRGMVALYVGTWHLSPVQAAIPACYCVASLVIVALAVAFPVQSAYLLPLRYSNPI